MAPYDPYAYAPPLGFFRSGMEPWLPQGFQQSRVPGPVTPGTIGQMGSFFRQPPPPDPVEQATDILLERLFQTGELPRPEPYSDFAPRGRRPQSPGTAERESAADRTARLNREARLRPGFNPFQFSLGQGQGANYTGPQAQPQLGSMFNQPPEIPFEGPQLPPAGRQPGQPGSMFGPRGPAVPPQQGPPMQPGSMFGSPASRQPQPFEGPRIGQSQVQEPQGWWDWFLNAINPRDPRTGQPSGYDMTQLSQSRPAGRDIDLPRSSAAGPQRGQDINLPRERPRGGGAGTAPPAGATLPNMMGTNIAPSIGDEADFIKAYENRPKPTGSGGLPTGPLEGLPVDPTGFGNTLDEPPAAKKSLWQSLFEGMAQGLPGALVAFAADRAHSPELAQQYTEMKRRELAEVQEHRRNEITRMGQGAEMYRHLASMENSRLNSRFEVEKNAQDLQRTLGATDPYAYSKAIQSLARYYASVGGDANQLVKSFPFLQNEIFRKFSDSVTKAAKANKPENYSMAIVEDLWNPGKFMSIERGLAITNGYAVDKDTGEARVIVPVGLHELDTWSTKLPSGVTQKFTVPRYMLPEMGPQIDYPEPNAPEIIKTQDPGGMTNLIPVTVGRRGGMSVGQRVQVPGNQPGFGGTMAEFRVQMPLQILAPIARDILGRLPEFQTSAPTEAEVNEWLNDPANRSRAEQVLASRKQGVR